MSTIVCGRYNERKRQRQYVLKSVRQIMMKLIMTARKRNTQRSSVICNITFVYPFQHLHPLAGCNDTWTTTMMIIHRRRKPAKTLPWLFCRTGLSLTCWNEPKKLRVDNTPCSLCRRTRAENRSRSLPRGDGEKEREESRKAREYDRRSLDERRPVVLVKGGGGGGRG